MGPRILALVLGLAIGAGLFFGAPRPPGAPKVSGRVVAAEIEGRLRETAAAAKARATTLAELPRLAAAVATDAATVKDLTGEELAFRPKKGETITIGQVPKVGTPVVLLTLPEGAPPIAALGKFGARFAVDGERVTVIDNEQVIPKTDADKLSGALAVQWPVDLAALQQRVDGLGVSASLSIDGTIIKLAKREGLATDQKETVKLELPGAPELIVTGPVEAGPPGPLNWAGAGLALLGLLVAALFPKKAPPAPALPVPAIAAAGATSSGAASSGGPTPSRTDTGGSAGQGTIGRYDIVKKLGSGGMAEVYLARAQGEAGFEKLFALKVLHRNLAAETMVVEHFLDEARLASRLSHPNIVQITDLGKAGDEYFIAMEYIDGSDLEKLLFACDERGEHVPLKVALFLIRKICDGLQAAHTAAGADGEPLNLVHRDIKSANIFVSRQGAVKVGDFGIAKVHTATAAKRTEVGMVKGTVAYMAPEQRAGKPIDRRADLYAVGAIAYELITGQEINLDLAVLAERGRQGWPHLTPPSQVRPELPPELDAIIWKALAYEASDRYDDCAALEEALEQVATRHGQIASEKVLAQWVETLISSPSKTGPRAIVQPG